MGVTTVVRVVRTAAAGLGIAALVAAVVQGTAPLSNYFSFFTIQSNVLAVAVLLVGGLRDPRSDRWAYLRGAVTLYLTITGIVYAALLVNEDVGLVSPWVNDVLHQVMPLLILADWVFRPPWPRVSYQAALAWLAYPQAYHAYSLIRGPVVDWYPYPLLDPRPQGYDHVAVMAILLAIGMAVLALIVLRIGRQRLEAQSPAAARTMSKRT
jgi:hypothetical protein